MRIIPVIILTATLFISSYAGTVTLPSQSWLSFTPYTLYIDSSFAVYHDSSNYSTNFPSCPSIKDSTDFFWAWYEACACLCECCPSIAVASKRPFYVSRKAMNYSGYMGNPAKLADTTLFIKCTTSVGSSCPFVCVSLMTVGNYGLVPVNVDSLYTRLLVFRTRFSNHVPLKIVRVVPRSVYCPYMSQGSNYYDSMKVTFGNSLISTEVAARGAQRSRSALRISTAEAGYVVSGFGEGKVSLEIVNAQGKTVYCRPVFSSPAVIGRNVLGPGVYLIRVQSQRGNSSIVLPVY
jgi:hypothetical protein